MNTDQAQALVRRFLRLMEDRDLESAALLVADEAKITFPGDNIFTSLQEVVTAASGRYQRINKRLETVEAFEQGDTTIVYVVGTLFGVNLHTVPFSNIRFIDRFVVKDGRIIQQDVWNDLAESGALTRKK